jgi:hypothetical protein
VEIDVTEAMRKEYTGSDIISAILVGDIIRITYTGNSGSGASFYRMSDDGDLYMYKEEVVGTKKDCEKFKRIYRSALRNKNIELLTDDI